MAESELPEVIVEYMYFFLINDMRNVLIENGQYDLFDLCTFFLCEPFITSLVSTSQQVSQFSGFKIIVYHFRINIHCQKASDILYHLFCINISLKQGIGSIQIIGMDVHQARFAVRRLVCSVIHI